MNQLLEFEKINESIIDRINDSHVQLLYDQIFMEPQYLKKFILIYSQYSITSLNTKTNTYWTYFNEFQLDNPNTKINIIIDLEINWPIINRIIFMVTYEQNIIWSYWVYGCKPKYKKNIFHNRINDFSLAESCVFTLKNKSKENINIFINKIIKKKDLGIELVKYEEYFLEFYNDISYLESCVR